MKNDAGLLAQVDGLRPTLVDWTRELVAIPTVNPYAADPSAGSEAAGQDWIEQRFGELGASVRRVAVPPDVYRQAGILGPADRSWDGRTNVVAEWVLGDGAGPTVLVNDHMDTVGTAGMEIEPFDPVVRDGRILGRGTSDTKGNLVMGLVAVRAMLAHAGGLAGRIVFESVVDEECNGNGAGTLACCLAGITGDYGLCLDGAVGAVHNGCNGIVTPRLVIRGRSGHSSFAGPTNAIDKAVVVKRALDAFGAEHHRAYPNCELKLTVFHAGTVAAVVPNRAEMQLNCTYDVSEAERARAAGEGFSGIHVRRRIEQVLSDLPRVDPWFADAPVQVTWIKDSLPYVTDPADPFVQVASRAAADVLGSPQPVAPIRAWFDGSHLAHRLGIPVVSLGMGRPEAAHAAVEFVVIDDLVAGAKAVALTLRRMLSRTS